MHRIDHATRSQNLHGVGRDGFTGGNPATQVPATIVTADWLNAIQEEIARAIETDPNIPLAKANNAQLAALFATYGKLTLANAWTQRQRFNAGFFSRIQSLQHRDSDLDFADDNGVPVRRAYWRTLNISSARPHDNVNNGNAHTAPSWLYMGTYWRSTGLGSYIDIPIPFPNQFSLDAYLVYLSNGNANTANIYARLMSKGYSISNVFAGLAPVAETTLHEAAMIAVAPGADTFVGYGGLFFAAPPALALPMDTIWNEYFIRIQCTRDMVYLRHAMVLAGAPGYRTH